MGNTTKDLETQIEQLNGVVSVLNIDGVEKDLKEVKEEAKKLANKIKKKTSKE